MIAEKTRRDEKKLRFGNAANVIVTHGCVAALFTAFGSVVKSAGDEILVPCPGWPNYEMGIKLLKGSAVSYDLHAERGWNPDFSALSNLVTDATRGIVVCSPSNPTGSVHNHEELQLFCNFAREHDIALISDEIYSSIYFGDDADRAPSVLDCHDVDETKLFVAGGVSKQFSMTGFRVGWLQTSPEHVASSKHIIEAFASCGVPFAQSAAVAALRHESDYANYMRSNYMANRDAALEILDDFYLPSEPQGAFYLLVPIRTKMTSTEFCLKMLREAHVATAPGETFFKNETMGSKYIRVSLAPDEDTVRRGVGHLREYLIQQDAAIYK